MLIRWTILLIFYYYSRCKETTKPYDCSRNEDSKWHLKPTSFPPVTLTTVATVANHCNTWKGVCQGYSLLSISTRSHHYLEYVTWRICRCAYLVHILFYWATSDASLVPFGLSAPFLWVHGVIDANPYYPIVKMNLRSSHSRVDTSWDVWSLELLLLYYINTWIY